MNYKEMLDKFEFLEKKLSYLENENKYLKERLTRLEQPTIAPAPKYTPDTVPSPWWAPGYTVTSNIAYRDSK
jgi:hypothetical protein